MMADRTRTAETILLEAEELLEKRDLVMAAERFCAAERLGAPADRCAAGRWTSAMLRGDFAAAWRESDAIRRRGAPDPHRFWNGGNIRGKRLMVRCLHGFGDAVQFLRYAPALRAMAAEVIFEVAPRFVELARCFDGVENVITWGENAPPEPPSWDVQMEVMELPWFFRTELRDLPIAERYLHLPEQQAPQAANELGHSSVPRVGLVWSAGNWNTSRSVPRPTLAPLLELSDCEFWNLQGPDVDACCDGLRETARCRDNLVGLAAVVSTLDLVITVDTLAAHLAGALGVPAWVMLQYAADWRWMTATSRSPWYPSLRLFRQPGPGDWESVVADVRRNLHAWSRQRSARLIAS
jgi:hypothetical protein